MYIGHSVAEFNIAADKTLVIGNTSNDGAIDSLAGTWESSLKRERRVSPQCRQ